MKRGGQLRKGKGFERQVAAIFKKSFAIYRKDIDFSRVPNSGGWDKFAAPGDIIAFQLINGQKVRYADFPFVLECKNWKAENVRHFFVGLYGSEGTVYEWMEQAKTDADAVKKMPFVIFKVWKEPLCMMNWEDFRLMSMVFGQMRKVYKLERKVYNSSEMINSVVFFTLKDFLDWIDWKPVIQLFNSTVKEVSK